jgi:class 3 adenylate cyclase
VVDFDALETAGIVNARQRAALIEYLAGLDFTAEEMVEAELKGRLFGLAGDVLQWTGRPVHSLRAAAAELGVPANELAYMWALLGLSVTDSDQPAFSQVNVATDLVDHPRAREGALRVRAGLGYGRVLAIGGDYFGNAVNLAARLVAAAAPGQILASSDVRAELPDWPAVQQDPLLLKGFEAPVAAYDLHPPR